MAVIKECVDMVARTAGRVSVVVKVDYRPGAPNDRLTAKVEEIERRLA